MIRRTTVQHVKQKNSISVSVLQFEWYFYKITIIYIKEIMYDKTYFVVKAFRSDDLILPTT